MFRTTIKRHQEAIDFAAAARQFKEQVQQGLERRLRALLRDDDTLEELFLRTVNTEAA